jgi:outer membrane autotransporter protein
MELLRVSVDGRPLPPMSTFALAKLDKDGKPQKGGGGSADKTDPFERWGGFVTGDVNIGRQSTVDTQTGFRLRSNGITLGTDYRFNGNHVLGAAVGFMKADTTLDAGAGTQDADGYSVSLFGSLIPAANAYIDAILNVGRNNYDTERLKAGSPFSSSTSGHQWGMAVNAGYAVNRGALSLTPFARVEYVDAKVDGFTESGNRDEALAIGEQRLKGTTVAVGGQVGYAISTSWGVLVPNGRIEYQHVASSSADDVTARIAADTVSLPAQFRILGQDKNFGTFAVGVSGVFARGISGFLTYERQFARDNFTDERYLLGLRAEF